VDPTRPSPERRAGALACGYIAAALLPAAGCAEFRQQNTLACLPPDLPTSRHGVPALWFKTSVLLPARDLLLLDPVWRGLFGEPAWNAGGDELPDTSFYTNHTAADLTPAAVARGACVDQGPVPPLEILKVRARSERLHFIARDARGRRFMIKLDHPDYPELGTSATIIGSRILWACGYHVPQEFLIEVSGTGDARFDGRRATASLFLAGVRGHFEFDDFRHRRELRGLRMVCAWLNDTDRIGTNTLVAVENGCARGYLVDFDSCLGAWQGQPKEAWRGWRHQGALGWFFLEMLTFGALDAAPDPPPPVVSPAVGRFAADDFRPLRWTSQFPNGAFERMDRADLAWIRSKIARLDRAQIEAIVGAAHLSDPEDAEYLVETLLARRQRILDLAKE
jgi:hypothetical protein